jgi:hypothetical protein
MYSRSIATRRVQPRPASIAAFALTLAIAGCGSSSPTGPSLSAITVSNVRTVPTEGNSTLCCCRIAGRVRNDNTVPVHVTIVFRAYGDDPSFPLGAAAEFAEDMAPGSQRDFTATGLLFACSRVRDIKTEVDVTAVGPGPL